MMHISEVDLNYALYYPLSERYISLFPANESNEEGSAERKKPPMWAEVERRTEEGTLDELRNRPIVLDKALKVSSSSSKKVQAVPKAKTKPKEPDVFEGNRRERRRKEGKSTGMFQEKTKKGIKSYDIQEVRRVQHGNDEGSDGGFFDE